MPLKHVTRGSLLDFWNTLSPVADISTLASPMLTPSSFPSMLVFQRISFPCTWWRHQMETFSAILAIFAGNSPVLGEIPAQRPVTRSLDVFFDLRLNKRLSKQSWGWWFETPSRPLWCHRNESNKRLRDDAHTICIQVLPEISCTKLIQSNILQMYNLSFSMNEYFHSPLYLACDYLSMSGWKLIHVSTMGPNNHQYI